MGSNNIYLFLIEGKKKRKAKGVTDGERGCEEVARLLLSLIKASRPRSELTWRFIIPLRVRDPGR